MTARAIPDDVRAALQAGRLEQTCPACERHEAAGGHCSGCGRRMGPGDWSRGIATEAQLAARRANGQRLAERGASNTKSAKSGPVAATPPRQSATPPAGASPDAASRTPVASGAPRPPLTVEDRHPDTGGGSHAVAGHSAEPDFGF